MTEFIPVHPPLLECAIEAEKYVAASGWDQPIRLFALVDAARFAESEPGLAEHLQEHDADSSDTTDTAGSVASDSPVEGMSYVSVEQEDLPPHGDVEELLAQLAWPPQVDGVAVALERIVLPPDAEADIAEGSGPKDLLEHPDRADIRLFAAVLRDGERVCLVRQRAHDSDDKVASGDEIAPGLLDALATTLDE